MNRECLLFRGGGGMTVECHQHLFNTSGLMIEGRGFIVLSEVTNFINAKLYTK